MNTEHNKKFDATVIQVVLEDFSHEKNFIEFDRFKKVVKHIVKTHFP